MLGYNSTELPSAVRLGGAGAPGRSARCWSSGSIATPSRWWRCSTGSVTATATTSRCSIRPARCATPPARWCASSAWRSTSASRRAPRRRCARSQELLQMVAAGTSDWLILVDTERRVQFINRDIRAQSRESIVGRPLDEIAEPEHREAVAAALDAGAQHRRVRRPAADDLGRAIRRTLLRFAHPRRALEGRHHRRGDQHHRDHRPPGGAAPARDPGAHVRAAARRRGGHRYEQHTSAWRTRHSNACSVSRPAPRSTPRSRISSRSRPACAASASISSC